MKLEYEEKVKIYNEWKYRNKSPNKISEEYGVTVSVIDYMVHLADRWGLGILKHQHHYYSPEFKEAAVKRVLLNDESGIQVSLDLGLSNKGTLPRWIKEYKDNGYNVVERKKGRHAKEENDGESSNRKRSLVKAERRATPEESQTYNRKRIYKKIERLSYGKRKARIEEIASVVTELRQELNCSISFIIDTINKNPDIPHITRSTYYYTIRKTDKDTKNDKLMNEIIRIYYQHNGNYGYRRITLELNKHGQKVNHKTVQRLMNRMGIFGKRRNKRKYSSYQGNVGKIAPNIIQRDFFSDKPNKKWYSDVTEFNLRGEKTYLAPFLDGCGCDIVSFRISRSPNLAQTMDALNEALQSHSNIEGLIIHTDQGWQYQHASYVKALEEHGIIQSMSRKGNCLDDALMENFFGLLKTEIFYGMEDKYKSLDELEQAITEYIYYYNHDRIKSRLKGLTPLEWRERQALVE